LLIRSLAGDDAACGQAYSNLKKKIKIKPTRKCAKTAIHEKSARCRSQKGENVHSSNFLLHEISQILK